MPPPKPDRAPRLSGGERNRLLLARLFARPANVLVLGRISDDPKAHYEQLKPLLDYVVPRMAGVGIREGRILMARDAQQMASYLRRNRVDWVTETSGAAVALGQRQDALVAAAEIVSYIEKRCTGTPTLVALGPDRYLLAGPVSGSQAIAEAMEEIIAEVAAARPEAGDGDRADALTDSARE